MSELTNYERFHTMTYDLLDYVSASLFDKTFSECNEEQQEQIIEETEECI